MINFDEVNKLIATCLMGKVEGVDFGDLGKHEWERDECGLINPSAFAFEECSGVVCKKCSEYLCKEHDECEMTKEFSEVCHVSTPDYRRVINFRKLLPVIKERCIIQLTVLEETHCYLTLKDGYKELGRAYYSHGVGESINEAICLAVYHMLKGEYGNE